MVLINLSIAGFMRHNTRISPDHELQYKQWTIPKNVSLDGSLYVSLQLLIASLTDTCRHVDLSFAHGSGGLFRAL